jgi:putative oxidoreductase
MNDVRTDRTNTTGIDLGLLVLRVVTGLVFFLHGWQKLFDNGLAATEAGFEFMGAPVPAVTSVLVTFIELIGGAALIVGAFTRIAALLLALDMLGAIFIFHIDFGFFVENGGIELVLVLAAATIALIFAGGGRYSADEAMNLPMSDELVPLTR